MPPDAALIYKEHMSQHHLHPVPPAVAAAAWIDETQYRTLYQRSIAEPDAFWAEQAERFVSWTRRWDRVSDCDLAKARIRWFEGGQLNAAHNCVDRHLATRGDQVAILWEGDDPADSRALTYRELHDQVCRFANALKGRGVRKGDRVCIYLPMVPEAAVAMLACARIGAVHSVVFGGFSPESIKDRILDSDCRVVVTADEGMRGGRKVPLKANVEKALAQCPGVHTTFVLERTGGEVPRAPARDVDWHAALAAASPDCPAEPMDAEDPLFILYTSGSTGKPKGALHTTGGYLVYAAMTHRYVFDYHDGDVYWCTADVGWITGHTYGVYGPLANGAITLMNEGVPVYPTPARFWQTVDKHEVDIFYTAPTAIRSLMAHGDAPVRSASRASLRLLGTVGEPINPEAWEWYHRVVGDGRCPIVDTWWQTETGGILITPLPGATALKPGSATRPFFGIVPAILDADGRPQDGACEGALAIARSWPGQSRGIYGDPQRFFDTYFKQFPGYYSAGDGARRDADGDYWITGRMDDVIKVSGHRIGSAEVESALVEHPQVAEAAVIGVPHPVTGEALYCFVTLKVGTPADEALRAALVRQCRETIGPIATPHAIQWAPGLPKTRSGKIMRRILRKIAVGDLSDLGDTTTLADPSVVDELIKNRVG
jgi:acetyl-CoA synthetase